MNKVVKVLCAFMMSLSILTIMPVEANEKKTDISEAYVKDEKENQPEANTITVSNDRDSGYCGDNLTWNYDSTTQTLTISGTGEMDDYGYSTEEKAPWDDLYSEVEDIVFEEGITYIGKAAFYWFYRVESITLPDSLLKIGVEAFEGCFYLKDVVFGNNLIEIGEGAFSSTDIESIHLPKTLKTLSGSAFSGSSLKSVTIDSDNPYFTVVNNVIFNKDKTVLYIYPCGLENTSYIIPSTVKTIDQKAFAYAQLKNITIPSSVKTIKASAFMYSDITEVIIPDSVTLLEDNTFVGCYDIEKIVIGNGIKEIYSMMFYGCDKLTELTLGSSITSIDYGAFLGCTLLESVTIPKSVTYIGSDAFEETTKLIFEKELSRLGDGTYIKASLVSIQTKNYYSKAFAVLDIVNKERKANGLTTLKMDKDLLEAAMIRAQETAVLFSHSRPIGLSCYTASEKIYGENIAAGYTSAADVMNGWMNSSGHRSNILAERYESIGIGVSYVNGSYYWVQCFGKDEIDTASKSSYSDDSSYKTRKIMVDSDYVDYSLSLDSSSIKLKGTTNARIYFDNGFMGSYATGVKYTSSNTNIATVSSSGKITSTGKKRGRITITAKLNDEMSKSKTLGVGLINVSSLKYSSVSNKSYTGKQIKPSITVKYGSTTLKNGTHYTVTYGTNKNTGKGTIKITGKGIYTGTKTITFYIVPKKVTLSSVNAGSKKATVKFKSTTGASGYQIAYKKSGSSKWSYTTTTSASKTITKLTKGKKYTFKVRAYKTVNGTKHFGAYSNTKTVKIK